jgi:hypothetical protein
MAAIVGALLNVDYGVLGGRIAQLTGEFNITSDGFVIASCEHHDSGAFIGTAADFERNIIQLLKDAKLTETEESEFWLQYVSKIHDWR